MFRPILEEKLLNKEKKSKAGAKPFDLVMMFKTMILQRYYNLRDKQVEFQILDRTSFKAFLGLESGDKVPDEKTVWMFRENITKTGLIDVLFSQFLQYLEEKGLIFNEGQIIDASFATAPQQRNTREKNQKIKNGAGEELWNDKPHKKKHKDVNARWTKKNSQNYFGYKNHTKVDAKSKFVKTYVVAEASVHDSQALEKLLDSKDKGQVLNADSAYTGEDQEKTIAKYEMQNQVN